MNKSVEELEKVQLMYISVIIQPSSPARRMVNQFITADDVPVFDYLHPFGSNPIVYDKIPNIWYDL